MISLFSYNPLPPVDASGRPWDPPFKWAKTLKNALLGLKIDKFHIGNVALKKWVIFRARPQQKRIPWGFEGGRQPPSPSKKMGVAKFQNPA